jgi:hypothetical protein
MKYPLLCSLVTTFCVAILISYTTRAKPIWTFSVVVAVEKKTADYYQTTLSKDIKLIVREQMATVNANFNSTDKFGGVYNFQVDSIYIFEGAARNEVFRPHPNYSYGVVIDGYSDNSLGGGWWGTNQTIYHSWPQSPNFNSGPFGPGATDGLTHEFGHTRGGVDIYGMRVEGSKNPVNGQTFEPVNSIMNFPYGNIVWDEYTTHLLNSTAGGPIPGNDWITRPFPATIGIKAVDAQGQPLENVLLEMYPVDWFSYSVSPTPIVRYTTTPFGVYIFSSNPFQPSTNGYPWTMRYSNFLIKATYNSTVVYRWLPLYEVQNDYFRNGASSTFFGVVQFPAQTPIIRISQLNNSNSTSGGVLSVSFTVAGSFNQGNSFALEVIDQQNNTFVLQSVEGTQSGTLTGILPSTTATSVYRVRITSSNPVTRSSDYGIVIRPNQLVLVAPSYDCQSGKINFNSTGGNGSPISYSAPGIIRSSATSNTGTVEQGLRNDPKPIPITASQNGITVRYVFDLGTYCAGTPPTGGELALTQPAYTCQTGVIVFNVSGGDGSPIVYTAPGIIRSATTDRFGTVEPELRSDPKPLSIQATQSGQTIAYIFDFGAYCSGLNPTLTLLAPMYDCATGAIRFNTGGGDGTPIEFMAIGITAWTTNPDQFLDTGLRTAPDVQPFTLLARQSGRVVSYSWNLKVACGRARLGTAEPLPDLSVLVLGNPVNDAVTVEIRGAEGQSLGLRLVDGQGRLVESRSVVKAGTTERHRFDLLRQGPGLLFLQINSGTQRKTVKTLKL